jgi:hypothetical protein
LNSPPQVSPVLSLSSPSRRFSLTNWPGPFHRRSTPSSVTRCTPASCSLQPHLPPSPGSNRSLRPRSRAPLDALIPVVASPSSGGRQNIASVHLQCADHRRSPEP